MFLISLTCNFESTDTAQQVIITSNTFHDLPDVDITFKIIEYPDNFFKNTTSKLQINLQFSPYNE